MYGLYPHDMIEHVSDVLFSTEIFWTMDWAGVIWYLPPNGITTVPAPIVESNFSESPFCEQILRLSASDMYFSLKLFPSGSSARRDSAFAAAASTVMCLSAPLEFRNSRDMSTIVLPCQCITRRGSSVTVATTVASRFSSAARLKKASLSSAAITTAILSWDSLIASSVPSRPSYFFGTTSRLISRPSASSPIATETPPAPKSLQRLIILDALPFLNSL